MGSILQKYAARTGADGETASESEIIDDLGAFGWTRGPRDRAIMLELRKRSGNVLAIGYGWLERIEFDPSEGITLFASGQKYRIKGLHLNREIRDGIALFDGICRHKVPWLREADRADILAAKDKSATVIESIEV